MIQKICFVLILLVVSFAFSQAKPNEFRVKKIEVQKDTVLIDSLSINPYNFKVFDKEGKQVDTTEYKIDFALAKLIIDKKKYTEITVEYYLYPDFLTKVYAPFDKKLIVSNSSNTNKLYSLTTNKKKSKTKLFDGLKTQGFIVRGLTSGNNQSAVTNSSLDLNIEGKLSDKVSIRANIFDTNIPLQENGYSQSVTDFDRVFVELYSKNWRVKGGDVSLKNDHTDSYFLNFQKQITGLEVEANISDKTTVGASGAIVRGRFSMYNFIASEGNQGPYKIIGKNGEQNLIIVSGSDKVYVNGELLKRGETKDYIIDYNLAEIKFNTTYPITNDMRIKIEFQYADKNYTRFITYDRASYKDSIFSIAGYFYSENDAKNQPLQQNLSDQQKLVLAKAGNDTSLMVAESAYKSKFDANKIQYRKQNGIYEFSTNENDELYLVSFTKVGLNIGDYNPDKTTAIGTIYKYVGKNKGSFSPVIRLIPPTKLQLAVINTTYNPSEKTKFQAEVAISNNDLNLFSAKDDEQNKKTATKLNWKQLLIDKKWQLTSDVNYKLIQENFTSVQRIQPLEFNRDWNLVNPTGNQQQFQTSLQLRNDSNFVLYGFDYLTFSKSFTGNKHYFNALFDFNNTKFSFLGSFLQNTSEKEKGSFFRSKSVIEHYFPKTWIGGIVSFESNERKNKYSHQFVNTSHQFKDYEAYLGVGDSTAVFAKFGFNYRVNDSVKKQSLTTINSRKTFYVDAKLINSKKSKLSVFINYKTTNNKFKQNEKSLNSRLLYNQRFFHDFLLLNTAFETSSGNIVRQDYQYIETESGQGFYTWIDYNNDGIKQFNEFEVARFKDQADYLRITLPNLKYLPTQTANVKQSVILNPQQWKQDKGIKKIISHFYNQTNLQIDNNQKRKGSSFFVNPFNWNETSLLGLLFNFRNSFYFNRGLQNFSWIYTFGKSKQKQQFVIGNQESNSFIHQLEIQHKLATFWLFDLNTSLSENKLTTQNLTNRNYRIAIKKVAPKITFLYNKNNRFSFFYQYSRKKNQLQNFEILNSEKIGVEYFFISKKQNQIVADFNLFLNDFNGNSNSPVGYQMLEGLQTGRNYTWSLLFNQKLNSFLQLNLNYLGRKSETSKIIHTGTVQLKAIF